MLIENKVALITGASSGFGKLLSESLLKRKAKVAMVDVDRKGGEALEKTFRGAYGEKSVKFFAADVANEKQMQDVFQRAQSLFGTLHIVVNNAGIGNEDKWDAMININLKGVIMGSYLAREIFLANAPESNNVKGVIINVASMAGLNPLHVAPIYSASKYGVVGFSRSIENWNDEGIRVNTICPAFSNTPIVAPLLEQGLGASELVDPQLVIDGMLRLIEDDSIVGQVMRVTLQKGIDFHPLRPVRAPLAKL